MSGGAVIRVAVIDEAARRNAAEQARGPLNLKLAPSHVRHLEDAGKPLHAPGKNPQPRTFWRLVAGFIKRLKPKADAQERRARLQDVAQRPEKAARAESRHHGREMALPWEDRLFGAREQRRAIHTLR